MQRIFRTVEEVGARVCNAGCRFRDGRILSYLQGAGGLTMGKKPICIELVYRETFVLCRRRDRSSGAATIHISCRLWGKSIKATEDRGITD